MPKALAGKKRGLEKSDLLAIGMSIGRGSPAEQREQLEQKLSDAIQKKDGVAVCAIMGKIIDLFCSLHGVIEEEAVIDSTTNFLFNLRNKLFEADAIEPEGKRLIDTKLTEARMKCLSLLLLYWEFKAPKVAGEKGKKYWWNICQFFFNGKEYKIQEKEKALALKVLRNRLEKLTKFEVPFLTRWGNQIGNPPEITACLLHAFVRHLDYSGLHRLIDCHEAFEDIDIERINRGLYLPIIQSVMKMLFSQRTEFKGKIGVISGARRDDFYLEVNFEDHGDPDILESELPKSIIELIKSHVRYNNGVDMDDLKPFKVIIRGPSGKKEIVINW